MSTPLERGREFEAKHRDADHIIFKGDIMLGAVYVAPDIELREFFAEVTSTTPLDKETSK